MQTIKRVILGLMLMGGFSSISAEEIVVTKEPSLCKSDEKNIFSCAAGKKVVSLCAVLTKQKQKNILIYRFGKENSIPELEYSSKAGEDINKYFQYAYSGISKGTTYEVSFKKGKYTYTIARDSYVYNPSGSGVIVEKNNQKVAELKCNNSVPDHNFYNILASKENFDFEIIDYPRILFSTDH